MRHISPAATRPPVSVNRYLLPNERSVITVRTHPAALAALRGYRFPQLSRNHVIRSALYIIDISTTFPAMNHGQLASHV